MSIRWGSGAPSNAPRIDIQVVNPSKAPVFVRLLDNLLEVFLHFYNNRTYPCRTENCPACANAAIERARRHYYAPALLYVQKPGEKEYKWVKCVIHLTENAKCELLAKKPPGRTLRGMVIRLHKPKGGRGATHCQLCEDSSDTLDEDSFDIKPILERMWDQQDFNVPLTLPTAPPDQPELVDVPSEQPAPTFGFIPPDTNRRRPDQRRRRDWTR